MARWVTTIDLSDVWGQAADGRMAIANLAKVVADRLAGLVLPPIIPVALAVERDSIADEFAALSQDEHAAAEEFDDILGRLYDWGDTALDKNWNGKKVCWIGK